MTYKDEVKSDHSSFGDITGFKIVVSVCLDGTIADIKWMLSGRSSGCNFFTRKIIMLHRYIHHS